MQICAFLVCSIVNNIYLSKKFIFYKHEIFIWSLMNFEINKLKMNICFNFCKWSYKRRSTKRQASVGRKSHLIAFLVSFIFCFSELLYK